MPKSNFTSLPEPKVIPPSLEIFAAVSSTPRQLRSSTQKHSLYRLAESDGVEVVSRGTVSDSNLQQTGPADAEEKSPAMKGQKRAHRSVATRDQASFKQLQGLLKKSEKQRKDLQSKLIEVTKESVLNSRSGTKGVWDQAKIQAEFKTVKKDIKNWIKKYGTTKMISTFSDTIRKDISLACTTEEYRRVFSVDDLPDIQELPKGAQLLLEGFLYAQSTYHLINRPFLFVDAVLQEHSHPNSAILAFGKYETQFEDFAENLRKCKAFPDQAQRWIASMLQSLKRLIIPDPSGDTVFRQKNEKLFSDPYRIYELGISQLAIEFLHRSNPVKHLLRDIEKKDYQARNDALKKIYRKFRELAYHMWCQPSDVHYCHELHPFDADYMELDQAATHGRQDMDLQDFRDSKVLIRLCPLIRGYINNPTNGIQTVIYLRQTVWTVDCQTFGQWKASQSKSPNEPSDAAAQDQETNDTDDDTASPPNGNCDRFFEPPEAAAEQRHLPGSPESNDGTKDNNLDAMEQD